MKEQCVGLFGTCGKSIWRNKFIDKFNLFDVNYFNPVVDDWNPEFAEIARLPSTRE